MKSVKTLITGILLTILVITTLTGCANSPANTASMQFMVTDLNNTPLSGAKVISETQPDGELKLTGITDNTGTVIFNDVNSGNYRFYISRFEYETQTVDVIAVKGQTKMVNIMLKN